MLSDGSVDGVYVRRSSPLTIDILDVRVPRVGSSHAAIWRADGDAVC
jgi:hypothetical protein